MTRSERDDRPGWAYYGAIALFVGILAFAVLGLVRSSSPGGARRASSPLAPTKGPDPARFPAAGPPPTIRIPPPTASAAPEPPSRTYIHPPPESEGVYTDRVEEPRR